MHDLYCTNLNKVDACCFVPSLDNFVLLLLCVCVIVFLLSFILSCLIDLICLYVHDFNGLLNLKLGLQSSQVPAESSVNSLANKTEEKVVDGKYSTHSVDEVAGMIRSTISAYEVKVQILSFPFSL